MYQAVKTAPVTRVNCILPVNLIMLDLLDPKDLNTLEKIYVCLSVVWSQFQIPIDTRDNQISLTPQIFSAPQAPQGHQNDQDDQDVQDD